MKLTFIMIAVHIVALVITLIWGDSLGLANDVILGSSAYLPLLFWDWLGFSVFLPSGAMLSPITLLGWFLCFTSWLLFYITLIYAESKTIKMTS
ncbi:MAG: hypothetical protein COA90_10825 [Gammaproteobacteria bacterium]|nr:MAG: hypothetical protein COA90_10825 [Gammaproteobacteria bacterium]